MPSKSQKSKLVEISWAAMLIRQMPMATLQVVEPELRGCWIKLNQIKSNHGDGRETFSTHACIVV